MGVRSDIEGGGNNLKTKKADKEYCQIEFAGLNIDAYNIPDDFGKDEYDEEFSLSISGCNLDNLISITMPPCYENNNIFEIQITSDVAKQIITAMTVIIREQENDK